MGLKKYRLETDIFMDESSIKDCIRGLKLKNREGFDRIPQRILCDGVEHLIKPLTGLFKRIYEQKLIPDQWKISKTIPIHKKGPKKDIENYRLIGNFWKTNSSGNNKKN